MSKDTKLSNVFFEDEIRCGFFVPAIIKQEWAVGLDILKEIDRICEKHHLQYFADWGTLLATVRHGGYVPWDDDLDIVMKREDYTKFCEVAEDELPEGFELHNYKNRDDYWQFTSKVLNKGRICFEQEHLERFHQFPYMVGVDIFVLDYIHRDPEVNKKRNEEALFAIALGDGIGVDESNLTLFEDSLKRVESYSGEVVSRDLKPVEIRRRLYEIVECLFARFSDNEADELTQLFPFGIKEQGFHFSKECYAHAVRLPFEYTSVPVPLYYDSMLKKRYGNYMRLIKDGGAHGYPYFEEQIRNLKSVLDFEMPEYRFSVEQLRAPKDHDGQGMDNGSVKSLSTDCIDRLKQLQDEMIKDMEHGEANGALMKLQECQQLAIDLGSLIEAVKGEGGEAVISLEQYCEAVFQTSEYIVNMGTDVHIYDALINALEQVTDKIYKYVINRKEIVFLPCKASLWQYMEPAWKKAVSDKGVDVFVVPIPYYYKRFDGTVIEEHYDVGEYPDEVNVTDYRSFNLELHHPDQIVFQNPFDSWHPTISVPPQFYSDKLQQATDELIYISPYVTDEFGEKNQKAYHNTQYYVSVPGVIRADRVCVQSESIKQIYTERLSEFAGKGTRLIWSDKIQVLESLLKNNEGILPNGKEGRNQEKKNVLVFINAGFLVVHRNNALNKLRKVFEEFKCRENQIRLIFLPSTALEEVTKKVDAKLYVEYLDFLRECNPEEWGAIVCTEQEWQKNLRREVMIDAYYGDGGQYALDCYLSRKPVMILN